MNAEAQAERLFWLMDHISDGILMLDRNWQVIYVNNTALSLLDLKAEALLGKDLWQVFPQAVGSTFYEAYHRALRTQESASVEGFSKARSRWIRTAIFPSPNGIAIYFHDITEHHKTEDRLRKTEADYRIALDRITDGFIVLDRDFRYSYVNRKIEEMTHRKAEDLLGNNVWEVFPEAVGSATHKAFLKAMDSQRFVTNIDYFAPLTLWQENYIYPSSDGLSVIIRDISDRKRLELELRERERRQQFEILLTELEARERERTFIGQELHDNVNQMLTATQLMLAFARDEPERLGSDVLTRCIENIQSVIRENRKLSHELVTPDLQHHSLAEELNRLLENMLAPVGIQFHLHTGQFNETPLTDPHKLVLYRIAQEQCTNILKHAEASEVTLTLEINGEVFVMTIRDNGRGLHDDAARSGIGLKNMEGRLSLFKGGLRVESAPGQGFLLEILIPLAS